MRRLLGDGMVLILFSLGVSLMALRVAKADASFLLTSRQPAARMQR
jgi:hypothetical protein